MMKRKIRFNLNFINTYRCFFFLAIILFCGLFTKKFFTAFNIRAVTGNTSLVMWLGMGFTTCMIAGHMDLTAMHMSTMGALLCLGLHSQSGLPWALAILLATLSGVAIGLINGTLATKFEIPSFIVTLGMQFVLKGLMYIYTGGAELSIGRDYAFNELLNSAVGPPAVLALLHHHHGRNLHRVDLPALHPHGQEHLYGGRQRGNRMAGRHQEPQRHHVGVRDLLHRLRAGRSTERHLLRRSVHHHG